MALEVKTWGGGGGGATACSLSFRRSLNPLTSRRVVQPPPPALRRRFVTMAAVKRSPKRLKYSAPRFTKVFFSYFISPSALSQTPLVTYYYINIIIILTINKGDFIFAANNA